MQITTFAGYKKSLTLDLTSVDTLMILLIITVSLKVADEGFTVLLNPSALHIGIVPAHVT
jgi:hypothetical protein